MNANRKANISDRKQEHEMYYSGSESNSQDSNSELKKSVNQTSNRKISNESSTSSRRSVTNKSKQLFDANGEEMTDIPSFIPEGQIIDDPIMPIPELNNKNEENILFYTPNSSRPGTPGSGSGKKKRKRRSKGDYDWDRKSAKNHILENLKDISLTRIFSYWENGIFK